MYIYLTNDLPSLIEPAGSIDTERKLFALYYI